MPTTCRSPRSATGSFSSWRSSACATRPCSPIPWATCWLTRLWTTPMPTASRMTAAIEALTLPGKAITVRFDGGAVLVRRRGRRGPALGQAATPPPKPGGPRSPDQPPGARRSATNPRPAPRACAASTAASNSTRPARSGTCSRSSTASIGELLRTDGQGDPAPWTSRPRRPAASRPTTRPWCATTPAR